MSNNDWLSDDEVSRVEAFYNPNDSLWWVNRSPEKNEDSLYVCENAPNSRRRREKARLGGSKICKDVYKRPGNEHSSRTVASIGADLCNIFYSEEKPRSKIPTHGRRTRPSSSSLFHTGRQFTLQLEGFAVPAKPLCYWWSCMRSNINSSWPYLCIY